MQVLNLISSSYYFFVEQHVKPISRSKMKIFAMLSSYAGGDSVSDEFEIKPAGFLIKTLVNLDQDKRPRFGFVPSVRFITQMSHPDLLI